MKKSLIIFIISLSILFTACGGGSGSEETTSVDNTIIMVQDQVYTITSGQTIVKTSSPTEVEIQTDTSTDITTAVLKSGSAKITQ
jgi:hypothetical protein